MRNKEMLKKISVKCVTAIMIAAMSMTPVAATLAFPVTAYAAHLDDNPEGSEASIGAGDTMDNNWGTITSNAGTLNNNEGTVQSNSGTLNNNEGTVQSNSGTVDNNWGNVTNTDTGSVETNHVSGDVTGGSITNNYGDAQNSDVTNNFASGTVTGSDSRVTDNFGTANDIGEVTNNYGTAIDTNVDNNYESGTVTKQGDSAVYVSNNYADASNIGEGVTLSDEEGYGQQEANPGPNAAKLTQTDPKPTAPAPAPNTAPDPEPDPEDPVQPPAPETPGSNDNLDYDPPSGSTSDIYDSYNSNREDIIRHHLASGAVSWNGTGIVCADGFVLTVESLSGYDCLGITLTFATQTELQAVYAKIFRRTIASNGGSVALAREEALKVTATIAESITMDMPTNYSPERATQYKAAYIEAFLKWLADGNPLSGAQGYAKTAVNNLKTELDMQQRMEDLDEINPNKTWQRVFISLTDSGVSQKEAMKAAESVQNAIPSGYTEDMTNVYILEYVSAYDKAIESGKGQSAARKAAQKAARQAVNDFIFAQAQEQYNQQNADIPNATQPIGIDPGNTNPAGFEQNSNNNFAPTNFHDANENKRYGDF